MSITGLSLSYLNMESADSKSSICAGLLNESGYLNSYSNYRRAEPSIEWAYDVCKQDRKYYRTDAPERIDEPKLARQVVREFRIAPISVGEQKD
jgi:hypothetical protein